MTTTPDSFFRASGTSPPVAELSDDSLLTAMRRLRSAIPYAAMSFVSAAGEGDQEPYLHHAFTIAASPWCPSCIRDLLSFVLDFPNAERAQYRVDADGRVHLASDAWFDIAVLLLLTAYTVRKDGMETVHWRREAARGDFTDFFDDYAEIPKAPVIDLASARVGGSA